MSRLKHAARCLAGAFGLQSAALTPYRALCARYGVIMFLGCKSLGLLAAVLLAGTSSAAFAASPANAQRLAAVALDEEAEILLR